LKKLDTTYSWTIILLFIDVHHNKVNAYGTVHHNRKVMPPNLALNIYDLKEETLYPEFGEI
jgi:hypothetical protein